MSKKPLALIILDGFGINNESEQGNAIKAASTPILDKLMRECATTEISASGMDVGLPDGQMGNSEVGHTNIGAGRVVYQELTRITKSITDGDFFKNDVLKSAIDRCKEKGTCLHLMGLVSDGGVHSHNTHLYGLLDLAKREDLSRVYIHSFLDGRDVPPSSGLEYVKELERKIDGIGIGELSSISGRYYAMDRDHRYDRVSQAYNALVCGNGVIVEDGVAGVTASYSEGITDEFVKPMIVKGSRTIDDGDSVIFFNFRPDRAREITRAIVDTDFTGFEREKVLKDIYFVCMTQYDKTIDGVEVAFTAQSLANTFGEYISNKGLSQLRIAETEKYAHVTFFFNGGVEENYVNEDRALIPSPKVDTYDLKPEMSAKEVTDEAEKRIDCDKYDVIILNYANCDMVGHTGNFDATKSAVETVDICVGRILAKIKEYDGVALITADHGNADRMYANDGSAFTAHTTNPVPLILFGTERELISGGTLADLAPTMLELLKLAKPVEMTGKTLLK